MKNTPLAFKLCAAALIASAVALNAQNLVNDPGFEASADNPTGNPFSPAWTLNEPGGFSVVGGNPSFAHSGNNYAALAPAVGAVGSLSQILGTAVGETYTLSFWLANNSSLPVNSFQAFFGGSLVFATTSPPFTSAGNYVLFSFNVLATSTSSLLEFRYRHDDDFWRLDDVSVTRGAVPEGGATLWLLAPAVAGLGLLARRRARK